MNKNIRKFYLCLLYIIMMMFCLIAHEKAYEHVNSSLFTSNFRYFLHEIEFKGQYPENIV